MLNDIRPQVTLTLAVFAAILPLHAGFGAGETPKASVRSTAVPKADKVNPLKAGDVLTVEVSNFKNLSTQCTVNKDGAISVPLLSAVPAAGKQPKELAADLKRCWSKYLINPVVAVSLTPNGKETAPVDKDESGTIVVKDSRVAVLGEVYSPGVYPYKDGDRLIDALKWCGGMDREADIRNIQLIRLDGEERPTTSLTINLEQYLKGESLDSNSFLKAGYIIYVPSKTAQDGAKLRHVPYLFDGVPALYGLIPLRR